MDKSLLVLENSYPLITGLYTVELAVVSFDDGIKRIVITNHRVVATEIITTFTLTQEQCHQVANALMEEG